MFNSDFFNRILSGTLTSDSSDAPSEMGKMRDAEEAAKRKGIAECDFCGAEIWYHREMNAAGWTWESEDLVGWCNTSKTSKHQPKLNVEKEK